MRTLHDDDDDHVDYDHTQKNKEKKKRRRKCAVYSSENHFGKWQHVKYGFI